MGHTGRLADLAGSRPMVARVTDLSSQVSDADDWFYRWNHVYTWISRRISSGKALSGGTVMLNTSAHKQYSLMPIRTRGGPAPDIEGRKMEDA